MYHQDLAKKKKESGEIIFETNEILNKWTEYVEKLFDDKRDETYLHHFLQGPIILKSEVENALNSMSKGNSIGIDEIKKRIATAKDAFQKLSLILENRNISMTTKFRLLKTYVWSTLTYGCECWTITSDIEKKIEAAEMWFIRRMLRISWTEKKPNVNVLREGNVQRSLLKTIRKRQMEFLGHVCRRRGLEFLSLTGKVEGKRDRGKQRITFLDSLCNSATGGKSKGLIFLSCLMTEMFGEAWPPMSVPDLAPDDDDDR